MSHFVIWEVSQFLKHTLWVGLSEDPATTVAESEIVLSNPAQPLPGGVSRKISLWLYQVSPNEHLRNPPFVRLKVDELQGYPPLALNLCYLLTPSTGKDDTDQLVLGKALQVFHDRGVLNMEIKNAQGDGPRAEELHISLAQRTIAELAEVWEAMQQPYRLSVCYEVRVVRIESQRRLAGGRVSERLADFAPVPVRA